MKTKRVIINFMRLAIAALIVFGRSVVAKMTGNANFINPNPKLVDVTAAIDDMEAKAALAKDGSKTDKSNAKVAKKKAVDILRQLAWWVEGVANGDENILTSSGFMLSKDPEPSQRDDFFIFGGHFSITPLSISCNIARQFSELSSIKPRLKEFWRSTAMLQIFMQKMYILNFCIIILIVKSKQ